MHKPESVLKVGPIKFPRILGYIGTRDQKTRTTLWP